jgi:hypothetical protein
MIKCLRNALFQEKLIAFSSYNTRTVIATCNVYWHLCDKLAFLVVLLLTLSGYIRL